MGKFTFLIALKMVKLRTNMLVLSQKAKKGRQNCNIPNK